MLLQAGPYKFNPRAIPSNQWLAIRVGIVATLVLLIWYLRPTGHHFSPLRHLDLSHNPAFTPHLSNKPARIFGDEDPNAYVFYATADAYACSALVNIRLLQRTTKHPIYMLISPSVSPEYVVRLHELGVTPIVETPPPLRNGVEYYHDVLLKLVSFKMHHYVPHLERILIMDSDQLVLGDLDHLFLLPSVPFAAPRAYWIEGGPISSTMMIIELSNTTWAKVEQGMETLGPDKYDMDLMQDLFTQDALLLPGMYASINSHWEAWDLPTWFTEADKLERLPKEKWNTTETNKRFVDLYEQSQLMHFYAVGKPWTYTADDIRRNRPQAHWLLAEQFGLWREIAEDVCPNAHDVIGGVPSDAWQEVEAETLTYDPAILEDDHDQDDDTDDEDA